MNTNSDAVSLGTPTASFDAYRANGAVFLEAAEKYRCETDVRNAVDSSGSQKIFEFFGFETLPGDKAKDIKVEILLNRDDLVHFVVGEDPNVQLVDRDLSDAVVGGATAGSAGTISTASTFACSTAPSSLGSAATAGTIGSAS